MTPAWFNHVLEAPLCPEARRAAAALLRELQGGPLETGRREELLEEARAAVAGLLGGASPDDVVLTSGGTEAANLAIKGVARARAPGGGRLIASAVEHLSVLHPLRSLARQGFEPVLLPVDRQGRVDPADLQRELAAGAALVSIQHANHEVGTIQPVRELAALARARGVPFHVDAVASAGMLTLRPGAWGADLLSLSGARLGAPAGTGALWARDGVRLLPQIEGGGQEGGRRAGSENLLGLAGLAAACRRAAGAEDRRAAAARARRDRLEAGLHAAVAGMQVQGPPAAERLPGHLHAAFPGAEGESLLLRLRRAGLQASTGSICASEAGKPSHVLEAMGIDPAISQCSLLLSLGPETTDTEVDRALGAIPAAVAALREIAGTGG